jgi:hypothetical protein
MIAPARFPVIGHFVVEIETAEPMIGEVELDLFVQLAPESDAVAVGDNEHPQRARDRSKAARSR